MVAPPGSSQQRWDLTLQLRDAVAPFFRQLLM